MWEGRVAHDTTNPVFVSSDAPPDPSAPPPRPGAEAVRIGEHLYLGLVTARLPPASGKVFQPDLLYSYDVVINAGGEVLGLGERGLLATRTVNGVQVPPLGYDDRMLPSFALPPSELDHLRIAYGSCRRPGYDDGDALAWMDELLVTSVGDPRARIHQLFLGGDQIYADDVDSVMMLRVVELGIELIGSDGDRPADRAGQGRPGAAPAGGAPARPGRPDRLLHARDPARRRAAAGDLPAGGEHFPVGQRLDLTQRNAQLTSVDGSNHLISFGEFAAAPPHGLEPGLLGRAGPGRRGAADRRHDPFRSCAGSTRRRSSGRSSCPIADFPERIPEHLYADKETLAERAKDAAKTRRRGRRRPAGRAAHSHRVHRDFLLGLGKVQRVLANVPTYMIFDDHDVTDDLFLNPMWRRRVLGSTLGPGDPDQRHARLRAVPGLGQRPAALRPGDRRRPSRPRRAAARRPAGPRAGPFPAGDATGRTPRRSPRSAQMFGHNLDNEPDLDGRYRAVRPAAHVALHRRRPEARGGRARQPHPAHRTPPRSARPATCRPRRSSTSCRGRRCPPAARC